VGPSVVIVRWEWFAYPRQLLYASPQGPDGDQVQGLYLPCTLQVACCLPALAAKSNPKPNTGEAEGFESSFYPESFPHASKTAERVLGPKLVPGMGLHRCGPHVRRIVLSLEVPTMGSENRHL
jgi:hypothetical protein